MYVFVLAYLVCRASPMILTQVFSGCYLFRERWPNAAVLAVPAFLHSTQPQLMEPSSTKVALQSSTNRRQIPKLSLKLKLQVNLERLVVIGNNCLSYVGSTTAQKFLLFATLSIIGCCSVVVGYIQLHLF